MCGKQLWKIAKKIFSDMQVSFIGKFEKKLLVLIKKHILCSSGKLVIDEREEMKGSEIFENIF